MIKRLLQTTIVLLPSVTLYVSKLIGIHELFAIPVAIAVYYLLYNSKLFRYYQSTVIKLHLQFPNTRILSVTDIVEYLCFRTQIIPAAIIMVITVYKMTALLFYHLIISGEPITLGAQLISEGTALLYIATSVITWLSAIMLYPAFRAATIQVSCFIYEKHNILIEDENKGE